MKSIIFLIFVFFNIICKITFAQNIVVINIQSLIDNNDVYIKKIKEVEKSQEIYFKNFENREIELNKILEEIQESKLILNESEINSLIDNYNKEINDFSVIVEKFNAHYQNQILMMRETILKEIYVLLEKYAEKNNIDLILDSTTYLIASNSLDITENIYNELNKININLDYKDFENN